MWVHDGFDIFLDLPMGLIAWSLIIRKSTNEVLTEMSYDVDLFETYIWNHKPVNY